MSREYLDKLKKSALMQLKTNSLRFENKEFVPSPFDINVYTYRGLETLEEVIRNEYVATSIILNIDEEFEEFQSVREDLNNMTSNNINAEKYHYYREIFLRINQGIYSKLLKSENSDDDSEE